MIVIRILNTDELARDRSWLGRALASLAPGVARSHVLRVVAARIRQTLAEHGVKAEVRIERPREPDAEAAGGEPSSEPATPS